MSETRKLAAILAADVVGYSRLMGEDEAGTAKAVREHREAARPIVAGLGGRIVKTTGDGLLLEFPSVVAAVECAIAIQKLMVERNAETPEEKRIVYRIGVNLGDVLIEGDDILGDGVNIAARLEGLCEPGGVLISATAYDHVRGRIDANFVDLGEKPLKNIARPVRAYSVEAGAPARPTPAAPSKSKVTKIRAASLLLLAALGVLAIAVTAAAWDALVAGRTAVVATNPIAPVASNAAAPAEAKHLSIVVLPFTNLSGDPSQDYFADGITENLTTDLSRIRNSFVIARNTAFTFKGKNLDAREIGKALGVRYVLEGSVQRDGARVRVNAQLIDAETGAHLWADRFEEDVADLFKLQDEVVARLANTLSYELVRAEADNASRSKNPDVVDLVMRGQAAYWRFVQQPTKDNNDAIRALFEQALKIDPNDAGALAGDAGTYMQEYAYGWTNPETDYDARIIGQADRSLAIEQDNMTAYLAKSEYLTDSHRPNEGVRVADAGLAISPNFAALLAERSITETYLRQFDRARSDIEQAVRLSPRDPRLGQWRNFMADAELGLGHHDAAIEQASLAINSGYRTYFAYLNLAAGHAFKGETDEAKTAMAEARRLYPKLSVKWLSERKPILQPAFEVLRKAGLPEE